MEILDNKIPAEKAKEIADDVLDSRVKTMLKKRYQQMKEAGKDILARDKKKNQNKGGEAEIKIGRNDPCSCRSGKKYKKCCGR
jgi:uncharacterized protein YecA (UPF0149 family)